MARFISCWSFIFFYRLEHWDVNNENLHGDYYEQRTGDPNITMEMFRDIHAVDQDVKLFLNDFAIIETRGQQKATVILNDVMWIQYVMKGVELLMLKWDNK